ncbi:YveK family protein [Enterococcus casseliflavus]|uniref:YveK family protein n=1 Tax=Enterococcus casseliflavus TaxID=37734 RepID=UPI0012E20720|nr:Wzz/FepE/Etk N-terminal domain-containing protein [Enterococcus casseliflavus]MUN75627.1 capsular biosynthesis protein [Enterococcus casseliflavus]MUN98377.1 capsular biosynthesis protein [Enterococcus casseliflavus]
MNKEINTKKLKQVFQQRIGWILMIISVPLLAMLLYLTLFAEPIYQKSAQLLISQSETTAGNRLENQTIQADLQLVSTYSTIIMSPRILNEVSEVLEGSYDVAELSEILSVSNATNSQIIEINAYHQSPKIAAKIANTTANVFSEEIPKIMNIDNVTILAEGAVLPQETPARPNKFLLYSLTAFLSLLFAFTYVFLLLVFERSFASNTEIEEVLEVKVIGEISKEKRVASFKTIQSRSLRGRKRV